MTRRRPSDDDSPYGESAAAHDNKEPVISPRRSLDRENPDRLYTITGGRTADDRTFDTVTLVVAECDPRPGLQSEHARILRMTQRPLAVVEISARLGLPVSVVKILLCDLLDSGQITARHPPSGRASILDQATLEQVLIGLRNL